MLKVHINNALIDVQFSFKLVAIHKYAPLIAKIIGFWLVLAAILQFSYHSATTISKTYSMAIMNV